MSFKSLQWWLPLLITITFAQNPASASMFGGTLFQNSCFGPERGFCTIVDVVLNGYVYNTTVTKTHKECVHACDAQPTCNSTNFMYAARDGNLCQLNSLGYDEAIAEVIEKPGWIYTARKMQVCVTDIHSFRV